MSPDRGHDGRFAPSPTGELHLGNLRTALVAWLTARAAGGRFLLRIDDLDPDRSRPEHEARQLGDLQRLGIDWDGAPARQSDRLERYGAAIVALVRDDLAYPCFCSRADVLAAATAPHGAGPEAPYPGTCAQFAPSDAARRVAAGEPHCLRARAEGAQIEFDDLLLGRTGADVDDFIVRRRDGVPAYNLASPLDEADLAVDEVIRGADLAPTTPRQLWVARALGEREPRFAHLSLVVGADGDRLAKRHGAASLTALAAAGTPPEQVLGWLATTLGIGQFEDASAPVTIGDLVPHFRLDAVPRGDVRIDAALAAR
ncbi:MAG: tRNA glutamyl-Q(34) synthetase GluQRS [Thermoleophilia bacterium]|nr:tRNA glutamyl-Q(34) synthetase GluQRS [Thermoleophilia bacterium]